MSWVSAWSMFRLSLADPARAIAVLRSLDLSMPERWMALALASALSTLLAHLAEAMFAMEPAGPMMVLAQAPLLLASLQFLAAAVGAWLIATIGRTFGGRGDLADAVLMLAWIELVVVALQAAQLVLGAVLPGIAGPLTLMTFGLYLYLVVRLTAALHGFRSVLLVALGMAGVLLVLGTVLGAVLGSFGLTPMLTEAGP